MSAAPLDGIRAAVLRVGDGADTFAEALAVLGATATTVRVGDEVDRADAEVRDGVGELARFHWVLVTSSHAARRLALWSASWPPQVLVGAVGASTASVVERAGVACTATSPDGTAAGLATRIDQGPVLFLAAQGARRELVDALRNRGIDVVVVVAYETVLRELGAATLDELRNADVIVATSPSGIDAVLAANGGTDLLGRSTLVAIGPTTSSHAEALGLLVATTAEQRDADSVAAAVRRALQR